MRYRSIFLTHRTVIVLRISLLLGILCGLFLPVPLPAKWVRTETANVVLYTSASPAEARGAVEFFDGLLGNLRRVSGAASTDPVRIVAFSSAEEFRAFRPHSFTAAFYYEFEGRDCIVLRGISEQERRIAVHELTHLLMRRSGVKLPLWYNEGIADFYSTMRPMEKGRIVVGEPLPERLALIQRGAWLGLGALLGAGHNSPYYNERDRAGILYAQSWLLVHMLNVSPKYRERVEYLTAALARGENGPTALRRVYGKTLAEVEQDLLRHAREGVGVALEFATPWRQSHKQVRTEYLDEAESGLMLGEVLEGTGRLAEAYRFYEDLARQAPGFASIEERLGMVALRGKNENRALCHLLRAVQSGSRNAKTAFLAAALLQEKHSDPGLAAQMLDRALSLDPDLLEARELLGLMSFEAGEFGRALQVWSGIQEVPDERALFLFRASAIASERIGNREGARQYAKLARLHAKSREEIRMLDQLLAHLD